MDKRKLYAIFAASFAAIAWGGSFIATKLAIQEVVPITIIWLRFTIGVFILWMAVLRRRQFALPARKDLIYLVILGFLGITFHQFLQATGLMTTQANTTAWIVATTPVFIAILSWIFLREKLGAWKIAGICLAAMGVLLVVSDGDPASLLSGGAFSIGDYLVLFSAPNWAIFSVLSRRGLRTYPAALMMFYVMGIGWIFNTVVFIAQSAYLQIPNLTLVGWSGILFLGVFCSGLAYIFWYDALQILPVSQTGAFIYLEPFVTALVAAALLAEPFLLTSLIGGALILVGVWIVQVK